MTQQFPELNPQPMAGDAGIFNAAMLQQAAKIGRRGTRERFQQSSVYTQVVQDVAAFAAEMRKEFKVPAPFMKQRLTRDQARARLAAMSPEQRLFLTRKYGVRRVAEWAQQLKKGR